MSLMEMELASSGSCRKTVMLYPSYLFRPSWVANHMKPLLSLRMQFTSACDKPCLELICAKRISCALSAKQDNSKTAERNLRITKRDKVKKEFRFAPGRSKISEKWHPPGQKAISCYLYQFMKRVLKHIIAGTVLLVLVAGCGESAGEDVKVTVKKGEFLITVTSTGELQAKNSENILGPVGMRNAGVWQVKISDLVPEGTVVKEGDYIATLDRVEISAKLKDLESEPETTQSLFNDTQLDTALELRTARDELINLKYEME